MPASENAGSGAVFSMEIHLHVSSSTLKEKEGGKENSATVS